VGGGGAGIGWGRKFCREQLRSLETDSTTARRGFANCPDFSGPLALEVNNVSELFHLQTRNDCSNGKSPCSQSSVSNDTETLRIVLKGAMLYKLQI
jgi:hypothetical protein